MDSTTATGYSQKINQNVTRCAELLTNTRDSHRATRNYLDVKGLGQLDRRTISVYREVLMVEIPHESPGHCHLNKLIEQLRLIVTSTDGDDVRRERRQKTKNEIEPCQAPA